MTNEQLEAMRDWVRAELVYALASNVPGADGYYGSHKREERAADQAFEKLKNTHRSQH